jgi:hypothetical protein
VQGYLVDVFRNNSFLTVQELPFNVCIIPNVIYRISIRAIQSLSALLDKPAVLLEAAIGLGSVEILPF